MTHPRSRWWRGLAALLTIVLILTACGDDDEASPDTTGPGGPDTTEDGGEVDEGEPQYGGRLVVGLEAENPGWTPGRSQFGTASPTVAAAIYDALIIINGAGEFEPYLAESLEPNDDLTEWTLTLRSGVTFHDGSELNAEVLKWNFDELHMSEGALTAGTISGAGIEEMVVVDDLTVTYMLSGPNAAFPDVLTGAVGWPASRQSYEELGADEFVNKPVGTGPFVVQSWSRDDRMVLTRNENYWQVDEFGNQLPYLDELEFRPIPDEESRIQALLANDLQLIHTSRGYAGKQLLEAEAGGGFGANVAIGNISGTSIFNLFEAPVDDIRVRQAMTLASDAEQVAAVLGDDGLVSASTQFVSVDSPWYSDVAASAYLGVDGRNVEAALELIDDYINDPERSDGKPVGSRLEVNYQCPPDPSLVDVAQLLQGLWGEIGIDVTLVAVEQAELIQNVLGSADQDPAWRGNYEVSCWRSGAPGDPLTSLQTYFGPLTAPTNFVNFNHPDINEQLELLRTSADFDDRFAAYEAINVIANENAVQVWNIGTPSTVGWRDDIRGAVNWKMPSGAPGSGTLNGRLWVNYMWLDS